MATVAVIGEPAVVAGWELAGALVFGADGAHQVRAALSALDHDVAVVVLTPAAAGHCAAELDREWPLVVVLPP